MPRMVIMAFVLLGIAQLQGCSDSENTRITFCKDAVGVLLDPDEQPDFTAAETEIHRLSHAVVKLDFKARDRQGRIGAMTAECRYEYEVSDEGDNVITQTDALSAYATLPYEMTVNGKELRPEILREAVKAAQGKFHGEQLQRVSREFRRFMEQVEP